VSHLENNIKPSETRHTGVLSRLKTRLKKNRLGELLVLEGSLSPKELKSALNNSRAHGQQLGHYLVHNQLVTKNVIRRTLAEQMMIRFMMAGVAVFISFASFGAAKQARAGQVLDVPGKISLVQNSIQKASYHPNLFGSIEKRSSSLSAFTKWTSMFNRFDRDLSTATGASAIGQLKQNLQGLRHLPLNQMATQVNSMMNAKRYVTDNANYGKNDYWATPVEFFTRGGDCEDFAIAKYTALRMLGVPENRLRIAIVQDMQKNVPHAILIVYTDQGAMLLDNQIKAAVNVSSVSHYKPIFSINQNAWWLHTKTDGGNLTRVASSTR
jgi:predicted transglutaminase-like cysteine proteinase